MGPRNHSKSPQRERNRDRERLHKPRASHGDSRNGKHVNKQLSKSRSRSRSPSRKTET